MRTDEQLAAAAQTGDTHAAARIAATFDAYVKTIARAYFDPAGSIDDLYQEARIGLLKAVRDWRPDAGSSFKSFLGLCVQRQVITHVKFSTRVKHVQLTEAVRVAVLDDGQRIDVLDTIEALNTDPAELIADRERFAALVTVLRDRLSSLEYAAAVAFFFDGATYEEIAASHGTPEKAIDNALTRVRHKLRAAFELLEEPLPLGVAA